MIVLDTNVVSETMRTSIDPSVQRWFSGQATETLAIATVTVFEVQAGIDRLATGRRRDELMSEFERVLHSEQFTILPFDEAAARRAGAFSALRSSLGRQVGDADMMIAGIAAEFGASIATRNIRDFDGLGLTVVDPWAP